MYWECAAYIERQTELMSETTLSRTRASSHLNARQREKSLVLAT